MLCDGLCLRVRSSEPTTKEDPMTLAPPRTATAASIADGVKIYGSRDSACTPWPGLGWAIVASLADDGLGTSAFPAGQ